MFDADYNPAIRAGVPGGVWAALDHHDPEPLLRLAAGAEGLASLPGPRGCSLPRATPRCGGRRRCRGRAARRSASAWRERRPRRTGLGPGAFFPFSYDVARRRRDRPLPALARDVARAGAGRRLPGRPDPDPPGRRRPANAARGLRARGGGAAGCAAGGSFPGSGMPSWAATRRAAACGGCSTFLAGRRVAPGVQARGDARAGGRRAAADARRPGPAGRRAGGARAHALPRSTRRSTISPSRCRPRSARRWRGPGLRGGSVPAAAAGRSCCAGCGWSAGCRSAGCCRGAGARRLRISGERGGRRPGAGLVGAAGCAAGSPGRARQRCGCGRGPPRPVAGGARRSHAKSSRFRHRAAFSSVRSRS